MPLGQKRELYCLVAMSILAQGQQQNAYVACKLVKNLTLYFISHRYAVSHIFRDLNKWEKAGGFKLNASLNALYLNI